MPYKERHMLQFRLRGLQRPESPGVGDAEYQRALERLRHHHRDRRLHAAAAAGPEVQLSDPAAYSQRNHLSNQSSAAVVTTMTAKTIARLCSDSAPGRPFTFMP